MVKNTTLDELFTSRLRVIWPRLKVRPGLRRREFHRHLRLRGGGVPTRHQCLTQRDATGRNGEMAGPTMVN